MKLALIRQSYNPYGGAERFVERALGALRAEGIEVTLISRSWSGDAPYRVKLCNPPHLGRLTRDWGFARCARRAFHQEHFDLVQSHERVPGCSIFRAGDGVHAAWLEHRARGLGPLMRLGLRLNPYHGYVMAAERRMFLHPALRAVICNSHLVRDEIHARFGLAPERLHVIYNGVDLQRFHPDLAARHRAALRAELGIEEHEPVLLHVGSGFERKGVAQSIKAMARAANRSMRLIVVGRDKRADAMMQLARSSGVAARVHFVGARRDVTPYYGAADAFVLPTLYDPFPNAILEALASGLPVVTSHSCGGAELIEPGRNGHVCDALDVTALARCIDDLALPGVAGTLRAAARQSVEHLSLEAMARQMHALYLRLLAEASGNMGVGHRL